MFRVTTTSIFLIIFSSQVQAWKSVGSSPGFGTCSYSTIQDAIDSGDSEIRVLNNQTFTENLTITDSIDIKGGFSSCLSAQLNTQSGGNTEIDGSASLGSATITIDSTSEPTIRFYNLNITGAADTIFVNGGHGIEIGDSNGIIEIHNSLIIGNTAEEGGGIYSANPPGSLTVIIEDSSVFGNSVSNRGGGVFCGNANTNVLIYGNSLVGENSAVDGGGIYATNGCYVEINSGSDLQPGSDLKGIIGNTASGNGAGIYLDLAAYLSLFGNTYGGGQYGNNTEPVTIADNISSNNGGGIYAINSSTIDGSDVYITNNVSSSGKGGAIYMGNSTTTPVTASISDSESQCWNPGKCSIISNNHASSNGGAIYMEGSSELTLRNTHVSGNRATFGTALYVSSINGSGTSAHLDGNYFYDNGNDGSGFGDSFVIRGNGNVDITILHNTIAGNDADDSRAIIGIIGSNLILKNSIISNGTETVLEQNGTNTLNFSCLIVNENISIPSATSSNDIGFVNSANDDYHLNSDSFAIDFCASAASNNKDADVEYRGWDDETVPDFLGTYDAGADESYINDIIFKNSFE
ncbi:MAG TPA: hypothetical protein PK055_05285 [Gammaproteobacteria bacterium]|nr:right-handed parallel beta-helix repeat-containing protein [Xanthomonadales bacterium]HOP22467.1 hypothetical protein [Gammaproteobacteria bacterium]HPI95641.1 hypothetical protein [Gammaproteobacteria bacterium]HPQ87049.1 hypothetical protein [Gammaproteobacteria bacterium]